MVAALVLVGRVPNTPWLEADVMLGFVLTVAPVCLFVWLLSTRRLSPVLLAGLVGVGLGAAGVLSFTGWLTAAALFKVLLAALVGRLLGRQVAEAWWLAVVALVALLADAWSVFAGPTRVVVERAPVALDYLLVHFPALGNPQAGMGLGMSDVVFLALFAAGSRAAALRAGVGFLAMTASLVLTVALALLWRPALPALPLISLAFLATNADRIWARRPGRRTSHE